MTLVYLDNSRSGLSRVQERLDKALVNFEWQYKFPEGMVSHLPKTYYDHCLILVNYHGITKPEYSLKPFCFEACWMSREDFRTLITGVWHYSPRLTEALVSTVTKSREWNTTFYGNIFRTKRRILARSMVPHAP